MSTAVSLDRTSSPWRGPALPRLGTIAALVAILVAACGSTHVTTGRRVVVLGIDGFDYHLARDLMARGRLPHLSALAAKGTFNALATSTPPLSPVAWSTFITGLSTRTC